MAPPNETPKETPQSSPEAQPDRPKNPFLEQLKKELEGKDTEQKKQIARERLATLNPQQLEELKAYVEVTSDIVYEHVGLLELVDLQKEALRKQLSEQQKPAEQPAAPEAAKPEGMWAQGVQKAKDLWKTVSETATGVWGWTKGHANWESIVAGFTSAVTAIQSAWSWLREQTSKTFGSLAAVLDDALPEWAKPKWLNESLKYLMGDYGVFQKICTKRMIKLIPNDPKQSFSLEGVLKQHADFNSMRPETAAVPFSQFGDVLTLYVRKHPPSGAGTPPINVKQVQLEDAAKYVADHWEQVLKEVSPATLTTVPVAAAAAAGAAPKAAPETPESVFTFDTIPSGMNLLGVSRKLKLGEKIFTILVSSDGTFQVDDVKYKLRVKKNIPLWGEELFSPSVTKLEWQQNGLYCEGRWLLLQDKQLIERKFLEEFLQKHLNGERRIDTPKILLEKTS